MDFETVQETFHKRTGGDKPMNMVRFAIYAMVYLGSLLMVYNIICFARYTRYVKGLNNWGGRNCILYIPIILLILFLAGYLIIGVFGKPDIIVAAILFGGSVFVFVMYLLLRTITQRILESEQMQAKLMAAEESNRVKSGFLASMSHEMRTPVNVILGQDSIALMDQSLTTETRDHLEKIGYSGRYLLGLINNVLDLNHLEKGSLVVKNEEFYFMEAILEVSAMINSLCETKGLTYQMTISDEAVGYYMGDAVQIEQVLFRILQNAVKYTEVPGKITFTVEAEAENNGRKNLKFIIADTGIGIDEEFLPKLFDVFEQEDSSFTNRGGSGLSLAVTKKVLELMGGTISVKSKKNIGSIFAIDLPLEVVHKEEENAAPGQETSLAGRRILIVEDIPENAEIVADLLELEDAETELAENGQIGLDMFTQSPLFYYDAILMDLRMPVMDGLEATRRIRALERKDAGIVPIIALTANAFEEDIKNSLNAGMNVHLAKPTDADLLYTTLKTEIGKVGVSERSAIL